MSPERRFVLGSRACGDMRRHIGMIGYRDVLGAKAAQLVGEHAGEVELDLARGRLVGMLIARLRCRPAHSAGSARGHRIVRAVQPW